MRTLLNVIWFLFSGLWLAIAYAFAGLLMCLTIVGAPFGIAAFRMAAYVAWPFGKAVVERPGTGVVSAPLNVLWFVLCGWWLALAHVVGAFAQALSLIGILNAVVSLKMIPITCFPFGKQIVDRDRLRYGDRPLHSI